MIASSVPRSGAAMISSAAWCGVPFGAPEARTEPSATRWRNQVRWEPSCACQPAAFGRSKVTA